MNKVEQRKATFLAECAESLVGLDALLTELRNGATDCETLNAIVRAVNSIKVGARAHDLIAVVEFAHRFEALLCCLRDGYVPAIDAVIAVLLRANEILSDLLQDAVSGRETDPGPGLEIAQELETLALTAMVRPIADPSQSAASIRELSDGETDVSTYRIHFVPTAAMFRHANEPLLIFRQLQELGQVMTIADLERLPDLGCIDPEEAYLSWSLMVITDRGEAAVRGAFELVVDDCELSIEIEKPGDCRALASAVALGPSNSAVGVARAFGHARCRRGYPRAKRSRLRRHWHAVHGP